MVFLALFIYKILEESIKEFWGVEATLEMYKQISILSKSNVFFLKVV